MLYEKLTFLISEERMAEAGSDSVVYNSIIMYYEECNKRWQTFLQHPNVRAYVCTFNEQFTRNPFLQLATFVVLASLLTPVLLFVTFAIASAVFAFIGFMVIEVTVLAIGATILSCILFCITSTFIMIGLCTLFIYYLLCYASHAFNLLTLR